MTLDEMKLAVCEKLPELIAIIKVNGEYEYYWKVEDDYIDIHWKYHGLQICHEAEKVLNYVEKVNYISILWKQNPISQNQDLYKWNQQKLNNEIWWTLVHYTYEQRLEAWCRVKFPKKFQ